MTPGGVIRTTEDFDVVNAILTSWNPVQSLDKCLIVWTGDYSAPNSRTQKWRQTLHISANISYALGDFLRRHVGCGALVVVENSMRGLESLLDELKKVSSGLVIDIGSTNVEETTSVVLRLDVTVVQTKNVRQMCCNSYCK